MAKWMCLGGSTYPKVASMNHGVAKQGVGGLVSESGLAISSCAVCFRARRARATLPLPVFVAFLLVSLVQTSELQDFPAKSDFQSPTVKTRLSGCPGEFPENPTKRPNKHPATFRWFGKAKRKKPKWWRPASARCWLFF